VYQVGKEIKQISDSE